MKLNFFNLIKKPVKVGLALSGGGTRGIAHIGVIKAQEENGIKFDYVAGTSAGSIVGAMYCLGMTSQEMTKHAKELNVKEIKTSKIPLVPSKSEGLEYDLARVLNNAEFKDLKIPFCAVAVDVKTGEEVQLTKGDIAKSVSASCAVPGVFAPVEIDDYLLFDGGLLNNIPSNIPKMHGCKYVVTIDVNSTRGQGTQSTKYFDLMLESIAIMMKNSALKGYLNSDVMIKPDLKKYKSTRLNDVDALIEEGYLATMHKMDEIKQLFGIKTKVKKVKPNLKLNAKNKLVM